jgi:hypothetical protein
MRSVIRLSTRSLPSCEGGKPFTGPAWRTARLGEWREVDPGPATGPGLTRHRKVERGLFHGNPKVSRRVNLGSWRSWSHCRTDGAKYLRDDRLCRTIKPTYDRLKLA